MAFTYRNWIFGGKTFCCCLPVRFGVIVMCVLGILISGLLTIGLWFQASVPVEKGSERAPFIIGGLVQTILFIGSILGLVGSIVRKQSFIQIYAYVTYVHFFLNLCIAVYLYFYLSKFQDNAIQFACNQSITNADTQEDCRAVFHSFGLVYVVLATVIIVFEAYGIVIVTRHLNRVKEKKRLLREQRENDRAFRMTPVDEFSTRGTVYHKHAQQPSSSASSYSPLINVKDTDEYDPYSYADPRSPNETLVDSEAYKYKDTHDPRASSVYSPQHEHHRSVTVTSSMSMSAGPPPPIEEGYGGGQWTHMEIKDEEKSRMERSDRGSVVISPSNLTEEERDRRLEESKSTGGPSMVPKYEPELPRYTLTDNGPTPLRRFPPPDGNDFGALR